MKQISRALLLFGLAAALSLGLTWSAHATEACKKKGACPLHDWMESRLRPATKKKDTAKMAKLLNELAGLAPDKAWKKDWAAIAKEGAKAAEAGDYKAARKACKTCHKKFRKRYEAKHRARKLP